MKLLAINHHYIRDEKYTKGIYPISSKKLEDNIDTLLSNGWKSISPSELLDVFNNRSLSDDKFFMLTFDDGLKCQYTNGFRILKKFSIGGLFFIPTCILEGKALSVHKLHFIRSKLDDEDILNFLYEFSPEIKNTKIDSETLKRQYRYDPLQSAKLKYLLNFALAREEKRREEFINMLLTGLIEYEEFFEQTYMSSKEIKKLGRSGFVGTHGYSHLPLAQLKYEAACSDIKTSINMLKNLIDKEICIISYPYGGPTATSKDIADICYNLRLKIGFTMQRGVNGDVDIIGSPLMLKRIDVNDLDKFLH